MTFGRRIDDSLVIHVTFQSQEFIFLHHLKRKCPVTQLQWHLDINIQVRNSSTFAFWTLLSPPPLPTLPPPPHLLTCIRTCLGRKDAHGGTGRPTAGTGCLTSSHWLSHGSLRHGRGNSWWWSWNAGAFPPAPQLCGRKGEELASHLWTTQRWARLMWLIFTAAGQRRRERNLGFMLR